MWDDSLGFLRPRQRIPETYLRIPNPNLQVVRDAFETLPGNIYRCSCCYDLYAITDISLGDKGLSLFGFDLTKNEGPRLISSKGLEKPEKLTEEETLNLRLFQEEHLDLQIRNLPE